MEGRYRNFLKTFDLRRPGLEQDKLDRALVAGLMWDVVLEAAGLPADPEARWRLIKARLQDTLVSHLAGWITLDRFRILMGKLDRWVAFYGPLLFPAAPLAAEGRGSAGEPDRSPPIPFTARVVRADLLDDWLQRAPGLIPRRPHRKMHGPKLRAFLSRTRGGWFRLKDFEQYFQIDRKTAWEYLQKLWRAGLLSHNQGRSSAVRYSLAPEFLWVRADTLRQRVAAALPDLPREIAAQVGDCLIASGGEAFWEEECGKCLPPPLREEIMAGLKANSLLEVLYQTGPSRMLRLPPHWLQPS